MIQCEKCEKSYLCCSCDYFLVEGKYYRTEISSLPEAYLKSKDFMSDLNKHIISVGMGMIFSEYREKILSTIVKYTSHTKIIDNIVHEIWKKKSIQKDNMYRSKDKKWIVEIENKEYGSFNTKTEAIVHRNEILKDLSSKAIRIDMINSLSI